VDLAAIETLITAWVLLCMLTPVNPLAVADQQHTATAKAEEALAKGVESFIQNLNVSKGSTGLEHPELGHDVTPGRLQTQVDELVLQLRAALRLNPKHVYSLSTYGLLLHVMLGDVDGAEYMFKRALAVDPGHAETLASYSRLLRDDRLEYDAASRMIRWQPGGRAGRQTNRQTDRSASFLFGEGNRDRPCPARDFAR
jgi:tetratricopeptide (TPR) repeat protein